MRYYNLCVSTLQIDARPLTTIMNAHRFCRNAQSCRSGTKSVYRQLSTTYVPNAILRFQEKTPDDTIERAGGRGKGLSVVPI